VLNIRWLSVEKSIRNPREFIGKWECVNPHLAFFGMLSTTPPERGTA